MKHITCPVLSIGIRQLVTLFIASSSLAGASVSSSHIVDQDVDGSYSLTDIVDIDAILAPVRALTGALWRRGFDHRAAEDVFGEALLRDDGTAIDDEPLWDLLMSTSHKHLKKKISGSDQMEFSKEDMGLLRTLLLPILQVRVRDWTSLPDHLINIAEERAIIESLSMYSATEYKRFSHVFSALLAPFKPPSRIDAREVETIDRVLRSVESTANQIALLTGMENEDGGKDVEEEPDPLDNLLAVRLIEFIAGLPIIRIAETSKDIKADVVEATIGRKTMAIATISGGLLGALIPDANPPGAIDEGDGSESSKEEGSQQASPAGEYISEGPKNNGEVLFNEAGIFPEVIITSSDSKSIEGELVPDVLEDTIFSPLLNVDDLATATNLILSDIDPLSFAKAFPPSTKSSSSIENGLRLLLVDGLAPNDQQRRRLVALEVLRSIHSYEEAIAVRNTAKRLRNEPRLVPFDSIVRNVEQLIDVYDRLLDWTGQSDVTLPIEAFATRSIELTLAPDADAYCGYFDCDDQDGYRRSDDVQFTQSSASASNSPVPNP